MADDVQPRYPLPPRGWKPPRITGRPRGRVPDYIKGLGMLAWGRLAKLPAFPDPEDGPVTYARVRKFARSLKHVVIDEKPPSGGIAKEYQVPAGSDRWEIYVDPDAPELARCEALLHGVTEIAVSRMLPNMAQELFPDDWRDGRGFRGAPMPTDYAHRTAAFCEGLWRWTLGWDRLSPEDAWKRHKDVLGMSAIQWHQKYERDPERNKGEIRGAPMPGVDIPDPDEKGIDDV